MPSIAETRLTKEAGHAVALVIVEEIARRRMSRRHLAELARISLSTLEKVLSGRRPVTLATLVRIEQALAMPLRIETGPRLTAAGATARTNGTGVAPDELGSYARAAVQWIEGTYLTLRPSFGNPAAVYAYCTEIGWDEPSSILTFREGERTDQAFTQFGQVAVPNQSGYVYLVTNRHGQHRLITLSRPTISGEMHGILSTLRVGRGSQLTPVAAPIALVPVRNGLPAPAFGQIAPGHPLFANYRDLLKRTTDDEYAVLMGLER